MAVISNNWFIDVFIILLTGFVLLYLHVLNSSSYWKSRGVKSVPVTNIFGNFADCILAKKPFRDYLKDLYFYGEGEKFIGFNVFSKPFLLLRDPEVIKYVLVRDFKNFPNRCITPARTDYHGNVNIFSLKNPAWKALRQKLSPLFTSSKLKHMFDSIEETGKDLDAHMESIIVNDKNNVVEMKSLCEKFTTDVIGLTMFGMKLNALTNPKAEISSTGQKHFENSYVRYITLLSLFFMPKLANLLGITFFPPDVVKFFTSVIPEAMAERIKSERKQNDLVDIFIDMRNTYQNPDDNFKYYFQDDGLSATGIVFFLGGFEPSASMMYLVLYELAKQPDIQNKLRQEITTALDQSNGKITYDMLMDMTYLDMVTSEGLRKYPLLHFIDRETDEQYQFPDTNIIIEKGTPIIIPMSALHMDPKYFPEPQTFNPERFSIENRKNIPSCVYFPFGEGPRNCIGMRIGLVQAKIGLIHILSKYEVSPCAETPIPLEFDNCSLFTKSRYNMKLNVKKLKIK